MDVFGILKSIWINEISTYNFESDGNLTNRSTKYQDNQKIRGNHRTGTWETYKSTNGTEFGGCNAKIDLWFCYLLRGNYSEIGAPYTQEIRLRMLG